MLGVKLFFILPGLLSREKLKSMPITSRKTGDGSVGRILDWSKKRRDTDMIYTYVFTATDGSKFPYYSPGQYITLKFSNVPGASAETSMRHYSFNREGQEGNTFSVSIQVEPGDGKGPKGLISNHMRDVVKVGDIVSCSMPFGAICLRPLISLKPMVLIAGGIGVCVTAPLLQNILEEREHTTIYFVHSCHNGSVHTYRNRLARQASENDSVKYLRFYSQPREADVKGIDYDETGHVTFDTLKNFVSPEDLPIANYILCGPEGLVHGLVEGLVTAGISKSQIQFECFGPLSRGLHDFV